MSLAQQCQIFQLIKNPVIYGEVTVNTCQMSNNKSGLSSPPPMFYVFSFLDSLKVGESKLKGVRVTAAVTLINHVNV